MSSALERSAALSFLLLAAALPWSIAPMSIAVALCGALTLAAWWRPGGVRWVRTPVDPAALVWLAALVIAALAAEDRSGSVHRITKGFLLAIVPLAAYHGRDPKLARRAIAVLLVSAALATVFALVKFAMQGGAFPVRVRGAVGHPLTYGGQAMPSPFWPGHSFLARATGAGWVRHSRPPGPRPALLGSHAERMDRHHRGIHGPDRAHARAVDPRARGRRPGARARDAGRLSGARPEHLPSSQRVESGAGLPLGSRVANVPRAPGDRNWSARPEALGRALPLTRGTRAAPRAHAQRLSPDPGHDGRGGIRRVRLSGHGTLADRRAPAPCGRARRRRGSLRHGAPDRSRGRARGISRRGALRVEFRRRGAARLPVHADRPAWRRARGGAHVLPHRPHPDATPAVAGG